VEALKADGTKLAESTIAGDSLRHRVTFDGRSLGQIAPEGTVRLGFNVRPGGQLYSFAVR
jgi:hypothetical protein